MVAGPRSDLDIENLTAAIHSIVWIDAVRAECGSVSWIKGDFRCLETIGTAALGAALFGLFSFWNCHSCKSV